MYIYLKRFTFIRFVAVKSLSLGVKDSAMSFRVLYLDLKHPSKIRHTKIDAFNIESAFCLEFGGLFLKPA